MKQLAVETDMFYEMNRPFPVIDTVDIRQDTFCTKLRQKIWKFKTPSPPREQGDAIHQTAHITSR